MTQCDATYFDGEGSVSCIIDAGHEGSHVDANGDWGVRTPLWQRRQVRLARPEARVAALENAIRAYLEDLTADPLRARADDLRAALQSGTAPDGSNG